MRNECCPNEFQGVEFLTGKQILQNSPKNARKLRRINDGTRSDEGTKGTAALQKHTEYHESKEAETEFDFQVAASSTLETDQFPKTQQKWKTTDVVSSQGSALVSPDSPRAPEITSCKKYEERSLIRRETENKEERTKSRSAQT